MSEFISGVCFFFNSILNPILYSVMSLRFRRGFSDIKRNLISRIFSLSQSQQQSEGGGSGKLSSPKRLEWSAFTLL